VSLPRKAASFTCPNLPWMNTPNVTTKVHSTLHDNDVIYHWYRELTGEEVGQLFDEHEQLLFKRLPGDPLHIILRGDSFEQAAAKLEILK
jgi:hypothetical protein